MVNLEFDLINLRNERDAAGRGDARDKIEQAGGVSYVHLSPSTGRPPVTDVASAHPALIPPPPPLSLRQSIAKKEEQLATEKRLVMRGWLKNLFLGQSLIAIALSGLVARNRTPHTRRRLPSLILAQQQS